MAVKRGSDMQGRFPLAAFPFVTCGKGLALLSVPVNSQQFALMDVGERRYRAMDGALTPVASVAIIYRRDT